MRISRVVFAPLQGSPQLHRLEGEGDDRNLTLRRGLRLGTDSGGCCGAERLGGAGSGDIFVGAGRLDGVGRLGGAGSGDFFVGAGRLGGAGRLESRSGSVGRLGGAGRLGGRPLLGGDCGRTGPSLMTGFNLSMETVS